VDVTVFGFNRRLQFVAAHFTLADLGLREQEIDDLVLVERCAQLGGDHRLCLDVFHEPLAVLRSILLGACWTSIDISWSLTVTPLAWPISDRSRPSRTRRTRSRGILPSRPRSRPGRRQDLPPAPLALELSPDLLELGLDHRRRDVEVAERGELIEQRALHLGASQPGGLLLELAAQKVAQHLEVGQAEVLGEFVVDLGVARDLHRRGP
jgi:hypothetical protein